MLQRGYSLAQILHRTSRKWLGIKLIAIEEAEASPYRPEGSFFCTAKSSLQQFHTTTVSYIFNALPSSIEDIWPCKFHLDMRVRKNRIWQANLMFHTHLCIYWLVICPNTPENCADAMSIGQNAGQNGDAWDGFHNLLSRAASTSTLEKN